MDKNDAMREQREAGVVFLKYVGEDGLRHSHPMRMESCNSNSVPWFPYVYAPNDHVFRKHGECLHCSTALRDGVCVNPSCVSGPKEHREAKSDG